MRRDLRSDLEQRLAAALERSAPRPSHDLLDRVQSSVRKTPQRGPLLGGANGQRMVLGGGMLAVLVAGVLLVAPGRSPDVGDRSPSPTASPSAIDTPLPTDGPVAWVAPDRYRFALTSSCGERSLIGSFLITVRNDGVTRYVVRDGEDHWTRDAMPTIDDLLAEAAEARLQGADEVVVETDPADGHPTSIRIDRLSNAVDDEACYEISEYEVIVDPSVPLGDWARTFIQPSAPPGNLTVVGGYGWEGGAVLTGQISGQLLAGSANPALPVAWYSPNGVDWVPAKVSTVGDGTRPLSIDVVFDAGNRLLALGQGIDASGQQTAVLFESRDDGLNWEMPDQSLPDGEFVQAVARFGGGWVAVGRSFSADPPSRPVIWLSEDGEAWESVRLATPQGPVLGYLSGVAVHDGVAVAVGAVTAEGEEQPRLRAISSADGRAWTVGDPMPVSQETAASASDVVHHAGAYIAVGSDAGRPAVWWGDGFEWRQIGIVGPDEVGGISDIAVVGDRLIAVGDGDDAVAWRSISGQRWDAPQLLDGGASADVLLVTPSGALAAGSTVATTPTGRQPVAWTTPSPDPHSGYLIVFGGPPARIHGDLPDASLPADPALPPAIPELTLHDISELAGDLRLACNASQGFLPDSSIPLRVVLCEDPAGESTIRLWAEFHPNRSVYEVRLTVLGASGSNVVLSAQRAYAVAGEVASLRYAGADPEAAEEWLAEAVYRVECVSGAIECALDIGRAHFLVQAASPGSFGLIMTAVDALGR
jgi:hypothetical protein